jgi:hypothetical protein
MTHIRSRVTLDRMKGRRRTDRLRAIGAEKYALKRGALDSQILPETQWWRGVGAASGEPADPVKQASRPVEHGRGFECEEKHQGIEHFRVLSLETVHDVADPGGTGIHRTAAMTTAPMRAPVRTSLK